MTILHYFEDNAMNYIALEEYTQNHGSIYIIIDHDLNEQEVESYVTEFKKGNLRLDNTQDYMILHENEFNAMTKLNHRIV